MKHHLKHPRMRCTNVVMFFVCVAQPSGKIEVISKHSIARDANRACDHGYTGMHVVHDGNIVRFHQRTEKSTREAVAQALRSGRHPSQKVDGASASATSAASSEERPKWHVEVPQQDCIEEGPDADGEDSDSSDDQEDDGSTGGVNSECGSGEGAEDGSAESDGIGDVRKPVIDQARGVAKRYAVEGESLTIVEWAMRLKITPNTIWNGMRQNTLSPEQEIKRRLNMLRDTGSARGKRGGVRAASRSAANPSDKTASKTASSQKKQVVRDLSEGTLADLDGIIRAANEHGGIRPLIEDAALGMRIRKIFEELYGGK
jgi:hypothetical protein